MWEVNTNQSDVELAEETKTWTNNKCISEHEVTFFFKSRKTGLRLGHD